MSDAALAVVNVVVVVAAGVVIVGTGEISGKQRLEAAGAPPASVVEAWRGCTRTLCLRGRVQSRIVVVAVVAVIVVRIRVVGSRVVVRDVVLGGVSAICSVTTLRIIVAVVNVAVVLRVGAVIRRMRLALRLARNGSIHILLRLHV